ncbi:MAG: PKD domain-containing protein, partial [Halobacteriales archaeon]|nr:PKD domain-containing protein [Halobacteriales archaeon]
TWAWEFGDGAQSSLEDPTHTYLSGGLYTVTARGMDNDGASTVSTQQVLVCSPGIDENSIVNPEHIHIDLTACIDLVLDDLPAPLGSSQPPRVPEPAAPGIPEELPSIPG